MPKKKKEEEETNNTQFSAIHKIIDQLIWNQWTIFYKNITIGTLVTSKAPWKDIKDK